MRKPGATAAVLGLVGCCLLWGYSFPAMQFATAAYERGMLTDGSGLRMKIGAAAGFNAVRYALAAVVVLPLALRAGIRRKDLAGGAAVGTFFAMGMILQTVGLAWTRPSVSSFLTAMAVIFTPLGQWLILRRPVKWATCLAIAVAVAGAYVMTRPGQTQAANSMAAVPPLPYLGEICTVLAAMLFSAEILTLDRVGQGADANVLTLALFPATAVVCGVIALALGGPGVFRVHWREPALWWTMPTLVLFSSVLAMHLMNVFQPRVSPATAAIVYCAEPVFGTMFSLSFQTEKYAWPTGAGGAIVLAAVLLEVWAQQRFRAKVAACEGATLVR